MRLLALLLLLCSLAAAAQEPLPTLAQVRQAIAAFRADPLARAPNPNMALITKFTAGSDRVNVKLNNRVAPWNQEPESDHAAKLLCAFVVGNVDAQLKAGKPGDQPEAGLAYVFEVYARIRAQDPAYHSPGVEKLLDLQKQGKLRAYLGR